MKTNFRSSSSFLFYLLLFSIVFIKAGYSMDPAGDDKKLYKNLNIRLDKLIREYRVNGPSTVMSAAARKILDNSNMVKLIIYPKNHRASAVNLDVLDKYAFHYRTSKSFIYAEIPVDNLESAVKELKNVRYIDLPHKIIPETFETQGKNLINADKYNQNGYKGKGVNVAVIDIDFMDYTTLISSGELPSSLVVQNYNHTEAMDYGSSGHGAACAEIIYDIAPEAKMYLIKINNIIDLENAKDYCKTNSIQVASMSLGWLADNFCDGTGEVCSIVNQIRDSGIFFVQAAGNHAKVHWTGTYQDSVDNKNIHWCKFANGTDKLEVKSTGAGNFLSVNMTWDAFPTTSDNYNLYLFDQNQSSVTASETVLQEDVPFKSIDYSIPDDQNKFYYLKIRKVNSSVNHKLRIFIDSASSFTVTSDNVKSMSILAPADSTGAFAVGAVDYKNYTTGPQESFSSQGPTNDGRIKPDIAAPDGVDTFSYGAGSSFGTSFAAPHVAGAACLLLSFNSKLKPGDLEKNLQTNAIDMGSAGKDNIYGYGRLNLPPTAPSGVIAKALSTTQISWQWSTGTFTNSNITGYNVYDAVSGLKKQKILSVNTSYWIEADLSTNTYYSRNITAFSDTSESDPNGVSRYTLTYAPFNLVVSTFGMHNINLAWSGEMNSYFIIDRSTDNLNRTVILSTSAQVTGTTYTDKNLLPATSYYYRIFAANGDGLAAKNHAAVSQKTRSFPSSITILTSTSTAAQEQKITRPGLGDIKVQVPPGGISLNGYIVIDTNAQNYPNEISKSDLDNAEAKLTARKSKLINNSVIRLGLYSLDGSTVTANFLKPFKLIISYPDPGNTGRVDNTTFHNEAGFLKIVTLNKNTLLWEEVPGSALDTVKKNVSADISHFSIYALAIVLSAGSDLSEVLVYPNPYVPGDTSGHGDSAMGKGVVFEKLTGKAVLKIFNIAGELVKEVKESDIDSSGIYIWDTKNSDGAAAASGVYIYFITNPDDATQKKAGKFSIIK